MNDIHSIKKNVYKYQTQENPRILLLKLDTDSLSQSKGKPFFLKRILLVKHCRRLNSAFDVPFFY